jgi:Membrane bound beta barrel domain (DUF5777)
MRSLSSLGILLVVSLLALPARSTAQTPRAGPAPQVPADQPDPDLRLAPGEPDFVLSVLPTSLRMPRGQFAFRLTHRFTRPIAAGTAGDFFSSFFGFDGGARIGLELRYGLAPGTEITVHRTSDRAIQFLGQHEIARQTDGLPITVDAIAAIEGQNNFGLSAHSSVPGERQFTTTLGAIVAHRVSERGAFYLEPMAVLNANLRPAAAEGSRHAFVLGLGARWRIGRSRTYVVGEVAPRVAGSDPGVDHVSVAIEKRAGGHVFQLTLTNDLGTTLGQVARGGPRRGDWFLGFNLTRKFF